LLVDVAGLQVQSPCAPRAGIGSGSGRTFSSTHAHRPGAKLPNAASCSVSRLVISFGDRQNHADDVATVRQRTADTPLEVASLAAATSPEQRLMLALTVVHAARRPALRHLTLDDLDLANRRITIGGHTRPLDQLTHRLLLAWLAEREARFPRTANRHLFVSKHTTHETGPVSDWWCYMRFRGLGVTLEQMRIDRQLDEALAGGGDPMHLAAVFGVSELTAMHYAAAARALLETRLESGSVVDLKQGR
jgi:integrase